MVAAIDFETYYHKKIVDIQTLGVHGYCTHELFDPYLVSIVTDTGIEYVGHPKDAPWKDIEGYQWVSHNASFDKSVFEHWVAKNPFIFSYLTNDNFSKERSKWQCTANMSAYFQAGRSLKNACKYLLDKKVSKDVRNHMNKMTPEMMKKNQPTSPEFETFFDEVKDYALTDAKLCLELYKKYHTNWPDLEKELSLFTIKSCARGIPIDIEYVEKSRQKLIKESFEASQRLPWVKKGGKALSRNEFFKACQEAGISAPKSLAKNDEALQEWSEEYGESFSWVKDRRTVNSAAILIAKMDRIKLNTNEETSMMPYSLLYFGAHTGRWSGENGLNMLNLNKDEVCGVSMRKCFGVKPPKKFIISDLSQIEARITPYLAGDFELLDLVSQGLSVYEAHAKLTMGWKPKGMKLKEEDSKLYALAKTRVLALGFGCGWVKLQKTTKQNLGITLSDSEAQQIVKDYRKSNPKITALWDLMKDLLKKGARKKEDLFLELPSGRTLRFINPKFERDIVKNKSGYKVQFGYDKPATWIYGAQIAQNAVQATARDVFVEALLRIEKHPDYEVLFHVYDETVCLTEKGNAQEVEELMSITPRWLEGCPIGSEAQESQFYLK